MSFQTKDEEGQTVCGPEQETQCQTEQEAPATDCEQETDTVECEEIPGEVVEEEAPVAPGGRSYSLKIDFALGDDDIPEIEITGKMRGRFDDAANPVLAAFIELSNSKRKGE